ncbi:MAG: hypothetical protein NT062_36410 [Proteobacteria bacterium]|nr:hypothetical protein [Pseudomonadota bacterium]
MSELAFNINGEAFDLPATATGWRVRRMKQRGAPEVVYGKDGVPLIVPAEAGLEELRQVVGTPGRYRLDAIDDRARTIEDLPASYVIVPTRELPTVVAPDVRTFDGGAATLMADAMRLNTELAKTVIERFPQMVEAAASLLRAADGAGLPAREPRVVAASDHQDADEDANEEDGHAETAPAAGFDLNAIVAQLVPILVTNLMSGKVKLPGLADMLDWRKAAAAPKKRTSATAHAGEAADATGEADVAESMIPPIDPLMMAHFIAVQSALTPAEATLAREVAADLSAAELRTWFDELSKLAVPDAVAKIRTLVGPKGGAS